MAYIPKALSNAILDIKPLITYYVKQLNRKGLRMGNLSAIDRLTELFLQTVNQYAALEKHIHIYEVEPKIYLAEIHTIVAVGMHENINITELAILLGISKSAASQAVSKLVEKGFVEKKVSPNTENEVILSLTEKGKQVSVMHEKQHSVMRAKLAAIFDRYPPETLDNISSLTIEVQRMWEEILETPEISE